MSQPSRLAIGAIALTLLTLIANHAVGRIEIGRAWPVSIGGFPRQIGEWRVVGNIPTDDWVPFVVPTATQTENIYQKPGGQPIDLLLVTATRYVDLHDPRDCFRTNGWSEAPHNSVTIQGQTIQSFIAARGGQQLEVLFWRPTYYQLPRPQSEVARAILAAYTKRWPHSIDGPMVVRVVGPATPEAHRERLAFLAAIEPPLQQLPHEPQSQI
jgi:hypothetical protein